MNNEPNYGWFHTIMSIFVMVALIYATMVFLAGLQEFYRDIPQ